MHCVLVSYYRSNHFLEMILKKIFVLSASAIFTLSSFARDNVSPDEVLEYKNTPQGKLFLHTYYPDNWKKTDKRPAVVFFFGGGWNGGSYTQFSRHADYLAPVEWLLLRQTIGLKVNIRLNQRPV